MKIQAWAILTTGLADGYELTKSPARVQAAKENGQTVVELVEKVEDDCVVANLDLTPEMIKDIKVCSKIQVMEDY